MTRRLATAAAVLWLAALSLTAVIASLPQTPDPDVSLADALHSLALQNLWLAGAARTLAFLGSGVVLVPLTVVLVGLLYRRGQRWWAWWLACAAIGGVLISQTVKRLVDRQRPVWENPLHELSTPSFPSGHSMIGVYSYIAFAIVAWVLLREPWNRVLCGVLVAVGVVMGPSRVAFGVHWPSDVLAGWLYACAWLCTVSAFLRWRCGPPGSEVAVRTNSGSRARR